MFLFINKKLFLLLTGILGLLSCLLAQQKALSYTIINRGDSVGNIHVVQKKQGDEELYTVASVVEVKMLITVKVNVQEEARYHKSKLLFSSLKRTTNGKLKANKQLKAVNDSYIIADDGKESKLNLKNIGYDFPKIYFIEPVGISQIYSGNYQKLLAIKGIRNHVYRINLPDGGSNTYYYENGVCKQIDMHGTLFNAQVLLNK